MSYTNYQSLADFLAQYPTKLRSSRVYPRTTGDLDLTALPTPQVEAPTADNAVISADTTQNSTDTQ